MAVLVNRCGHRVTHPGNNPHALHEVEETQIKVAEQVGVVGEKKAAIWRKHVVELVVVDAVPVAHLEFAANDAAQRPGGHRTKLDLQIESERDLSSPGAVVLPRVRVVERPKFADFRV